jgi:hypothetical protein
VQRWRPTDWGGKNITNSYIAQEKRQTAHNRPCATFHSPVKSFQTLGFKIGQKTASSQQNETKTKDQPWLRMKNAQKTQTCRPKGVDTQLSHLGRDSHAFHGFVNPPVVRASTVLFENMDAMEARGERFPAETEIHLWPQWARQPSMRWWTRSTRLEEAAGTVLVPSGLAAVTVPLLAVARPGLHVLVPDNVYWPTRRFCDQTLEAAWRGNRLL